jgi:phage terminase large subunit-like protein
VLADLLDDQTVAEFETLPEHNRIAFVAHAQWISQAHPYQIPPDLHIDDSIFLMLAGRGAGKTM